MSTTTTAASIDESYRLGIDADSAFRDLVFHEPTVCSRCFATIRRYDTYRPDATQGVSKYAPEERCVRAFDGEKGYKHEHFDHDEYGYRPFHRPRTFCGECGSQSGRAEDLTLSRRAALACVETLVEQLVTAGVTVHTRAVRETVRRMKSNPDLKDYDTEIFERATKLGIKFARCHPHSPFVVTPYDR
jgi:hypothetical protein